MTACLRELAASHNKTPLALFDPIEQLPFVLGQAEFMLRLGLGSGTDKILFS